MSAEVIDVEAAEIVPVGQVSIYRSSDAQAQLEEAKERAKVLVQVVQDQGLARSFGGGRPHVQVEGWQFLASQFGLIPDIEWSRQLPDGVGWEARAALRRLSDGVVIAHGDAECRRDESNWQSRDSYALRSMAQTRAVSKVCRIALSSVMVMAGFAATPAEEAEATEITADDPHCPACLAVNGELVGVWQNDKSPFWKCKNKPADCAGASPDKNGKLWSWSGWHESYENSAEEWLVDNNYQTEVVIRERSNYWPWVLTEIMETLGLGDQAEAKPMAKAGLASVVYDNKVDLAAIFDTPPSGDLSDDDLAVVAQNLTAGEAQLVVSTACEYASKPETAPL